MPIYEYECEKCGNTLEILQSFSEKPLTKCPHCSGKVHKLISHSSFHLKGSGWYVTDYSNKKSAGAPASTNKSEKQGTGVSETAKTSGTAGSPSD